MRAAVVSAVRANESILPAVCFLLLPIWPVVRCCAAEVKRVRNVVPHRCRGLAGRYLRSVSDLTFYRFLSCTRNVFSLEMFFRLMQILAPLSREVQLPPRQCLRSSPPHGMRFVACSPRYKVMSWWRPLPKMLRYATLRRAKMSRLK